MTPYEIVVANYQMPFPLYPFQVEAVDELAPLPRSSLLWEPGLGKTAGSTCCALYKLAGSADTVLCILPPILIIQWQKWLAKVKHKDGRPFRVLAYKGAPAERKGMSFDADFVLMSIQIFKRDIERVERELYGKNVHILLDEAQCLRDVSSQNYKTVRDFIGDNTIQLLTGTPLNNVLDAYPFIKVVAPSIYRNLNQFLQIHVAEKDFFGNAISFANLGLLKDNLLVNASRKTKEDVLLDLPECTIVPMEYDLHPYHMKLYQRIVNEQLLKFDDNTKLDLTSATSLYHALGQVVCQLDFFSQDDTKVSAVFDLVDEVVAELEGRKLIIFANYKRTNAAIVKRYGCPGVWGDVSAKDKQIALDRFVEDPTCTLITMQPASGGVGWEGAQTVCQDILYVEPPVSVSQLTQSLSRVHRNGQKNAVTVRMAIATGTIQKHVTDRLADKEALVNPLQLSKAVLKAALLGASDARISSHLEVV